MPTRHRRARQANKDVVIDTSALVGRHVAVAYNIPRCIQRRPDVETACYSLREATPYRRDRTRFRPGKLVLGYVYSILLQDVQWWVSQAGIDPICVQKSLWAAFTINPRWEKPMRVVAYGTTRGSPYGPS